MLMRGQQNDLELLRPNNFWIIPTILGYLFHRANTTLVWPLFNTAL
jgi:hypothetical protein